MRSEPEGLGAQLEELRDRVTELAGTDAAVAEMLGALEETVTRETEVLNAILEQLPFGATLLDPSYRVTFFNRRAREITGRRADGATPLVDWPIELFHPDGRPMGFEERPSVRALRGEISSNVVYEARDPERPAYFVNASSTPIRNSAGEVIYALSVFEDVTDARRRERADEEFIANAAHQILMPISAIASACGALNAGAKDDPEARELFLGHIEREVERMQKLAAALLTLAHTERDGAPAPRSPIALRPLLTQVIELSLRKEGVRIELRCPEEVSAVTNAALLSEAVENVVTNAVQHTEHGTVAVTGAQSEGSTRIEIVDGGSGIPRQDRARVFERFFRGSRPVGTGAGLGLAIAAAATHAAGGVLELVDSPVGTCFRFTLDNTPLA
jgi:PAS domain S-box-containing protein